MTLTDAGARLLPGISDGLAAFARAVELVRATAADAPLIVTTTRACPQLAARGRLSM
jgi:DNA-binding transcriptional LysR family regulator